MNNENKTFAKGICFYKLFIVFLIGCIFGNYYEMILNLIRHFLRDGSFFWEVRRGLIYGPLSPIYGLGAVIITYFLAEKNHKWYQTIIYGSLLGGSCEYIMSLLQEIFIGSSSWNYKNRILNINGRTTIPIMLLWGLLSYIFVKIIYPRISNLIEKIPNNVGTKITKTLIILVSIDMLISFTAVIRQGLRKKDIPPYTIIGEICDKVYTDERLKKAYPNMVFKGE